MADLPQLARGQMSRRAFMGVGAVSMTALAGCSSSPATPGVHAEPRAASVTPDVRTATAALTAIRSTHAAVRATAQHFPAIRSRLTDLDAMHAAHERSLVDAVPAQARSAAAPAAYAVPARRDAALLRLQAAEVRLHDTLQALALRAESGEFARLLASMGAAVTVHRQVLAGAGG